MWTIATIIFAAWLGLCLTSPTKVSLATYLLLILVCYVVPIIGTFFVRVSVVDDKYLVVPMGAFLKRKILIQDISALDYRQHGLGLLSGITVQYRTAKYDKQSILPAFTTFGRKTTSMIVNQLISINPEIKIDAKIKSRLVS